MPTYRVVLFTSINPVLTILYKQVPRLRYTSASLRDCFLVILDWAKWRRLTVTGEKLLKLHGKTQMSEKFSFRLWKMIFLGYSVFF